MDEKLFQKQIGIPVYYTVKDFTINRKTFLIGHGDGLGPHDKKYKLLKKIFRNSTSQWLFGLLPPNLGMSLASYFSNKSRIATGSAEEIFLGEEKEWLIMYCKEVLKNKKVDFFIFGHRHLPIDFRLYNGSRYINLGDWINYYTYAVFDGNELTLKSYTGQESKIIKN